MTLSKKIIKRSAVAVILIFIAMNIIAAFHAYKFTHFTKSAVDKTKDPTKLSFVDKLSILLFGINNPRPTNAIKPHWPYRTIVLKSSKRIECWYVEVEMAKGTVVLFHGYSGSKSGKVDHAALFNRLGYNALLVDFMGSGGSEGNQTTLGYYEAEQVKAAFAYVRQELKQPNIILYGTSMGAVAIMKYLNDGGENPVSVILECPFGTMLKTVQARFKTMHIPPFPMANLLVFWGGIENDFNAFAHKPQEYAKRIKCPVMLMDGEKDDKVSREEIDDIYRNLPGSKVLKLYPKAGHEEYLKVQPVEWERDVVAFLQRQRCYK